MDLISQDSENEKSPLRNDAEKGLNTDYKDTNFFNKLTFKG